jgi:hypothetical protein
MRRAIVDDDRRWRTLLRMIERVTLGDNIGSKSRSCSAIAHTVREAHAGSELACWTTGLEARPLMTNLLGHAALRAVLGTSLMRTMAREP